MLPSQFRRELLEDGVGAEGSHALYPSLSLKGGEHGGSCEGATWNHCGVPSQVLTARAQTQKSVCESTDLPRVSSQTPGRSQRASVWRCVAPVFESDAGTYGCLMACERRFEASEVLLPLGAARTVTPAGLDLNVFSFANWHFHQLSGVR